VTTMGTTWHQMAARSRYMRQPQELKAVLTNDICENKWLRQWGHLVQSENQFWSKVLEVGPPNSRTYQNRITRTECQMTALDSTLINDIEWVTEWERFNTLHVGFNILVSGHHIGNFIIESQTLTLVLASGHS